MCVGPCGEVFAAAAKLNEFSSGKKKVEHEPKNKSIS